MCFTARVRGRLRKAGNFSETRELWKDSIRDGYPALRLEALVKMANCITSIVDLSFVADQINTSNEAEADLLDLIRPKLEQLILEAADKAVNANEVRRYLDVYGNYCRQKSRDALREKLEQMLFQEIDQSTDRVGAVGLITLAINSGLGDCQQAAAHKLLMMTHTPQGFFDEARASNAVINDEAWQHLAQLLREQLSETDTNGVPRAAEHGG